VNNLPSKNKRKLNRFLYAIIVISLVFSTNLFFYQKSSAFIPFGGPIILPIICVNGILLTIGPPVGGLLIFPWEATLFAFYAIKPGSLTLGLYSPGGACEAPGGCFACPPIPTQGTIIMMGTSY